MADKKPDQEPSIEEILASIRQIISDDESGESPVVESAPPPPSAAPPPPPPVEDDVIDLTETVDPEPEEKPIQVALRESEPEPVAAPEPEPEPDPLPEDDFVMVESSEEETAPPLNENSYADESAIDSLLTDRAEKAALSAFSKITARAPVYRDDTPTDGHTIEDVVRGLLRPLLREWLDENLPPMIEKLVQRELQRLARRTMAE